MKRLISTATTVAEARKKESACLTLFGEGGYQIKLSGMWIDANGNNVWGIEDAHLHVVSINRDYIIMNDTTGYGIFKVKPDPEPSSMRKPEVRFYA